MWRWPKEELTEERERKGEKQREKLGSSSRRRRHTASLCARLRLGTLASLFVYWSSHCARRCIYILRLHIHMRYIKTGWYSEVREGRFLITRRVDQPFSLVLALPLFPLSIRSFSIYFLFPLCLSCIVSVSSAKLSFSLYLSLYNLRRFFSFCLSLYTVFVVEVIFLLSLSLLYDLCR